MTDYLTIDDINIKNKTILCRLDLNSPMDLYGNILDDKRFRSHISTLKELCDAKTVILSHQSRPGKRDFTTMEPHSKILSKLMGKNITYVDDIFGTHAIDSIKNMEQGDIIILENTRFYSEETLIHDPELQAKTQMVKRLSSVSDIFLNDAFSVSHRPHISVTGFSRMIPCIAGKVMEKEINSLNKALYSNLHPCVYVLGGTKVDDSIKVIQNVLSKNSADKILVTGVVANVFLAADGINIGSVNMDFIIKQGYVSYIDIAKELLKKYKDKITLPIDVALNKNEERLEEKVSNLNSNLQIQDIGIETIVKFSEEIKNSEIVIMNGPAGVFEKKEFSLGTYELIKAGTKSNFSIIGGGHISASVEQLGISDKFSHISTGGGACISFLAGEMLPGIEILKDSVKKYYKL